MKTSASVNLRKALPENAVPALIEIRRTASGLRPSVLDRLKKLIQKQGLQPGMKLPPEREVAAKLSVGRPAVREAIKALSSLDVLESRRGDGTYIKSLNAISSDSSSLALPGNSQVDLIELLETAEDDRA